MYRTQKKDKNLHYEIEILQVKVEQMEKRFELLERAMSLMERTHKAEMTLLNEKSYSESSVSDDSEEEIVPTNKIESNHRLVASMLRRTT